MPTGHSIAFVCVFTGLECTPTRMCQACPGCTLANQTHGKLSELVYNFPVEATFLVMFFDAYSAGKHTGFEGSECHLIGCCGMCSFVCIEPITRASATTFASTIMKILLRYGFCHAVALDKDSKFFSCLTSTFAILPIGATMPSTNVIGFNFTAVRTFFICR